MAKDSHLVIEQKQKEIPDCNDCIHVAVCACSMNMCIFLERHKDFWHKLSIKQPNLKQPVIHPVVKQAKRFLANNCMKFKKGI